MKKLILVISLAFLFCNKTECKNNEQDSGYFVTAETDTIKIDHFNTIPKYFEGSGCCYFSSIEDEKAEKYMYVDDLCGSSCMKINNKMERFYFLPGKSNDSISVFRNKNYEIEVITKRTWEKGYECFNSEGIIIISDRKGNSVKQTFVGYCGW